MRMLRKDYTTKGKVTVADELTEFQSEMSQFILMEAVTCAGRDFVVQAKGKAVCKDTDTPDERVGCAIAGARADLKAQKYISKSYEMAAEKLEKAAKEARELEAKHKAEANRIEKAIEKLSK